MAALMKAMELKRPERLCYGDLQHPKLPLIPGHEIVGIVDRWESASIRIGSASSRRPPGRPYLRVLSLLQNRCGEPL